MATYKVKLELSKLDFNFLECPVCFKIPKAHIYICITGHSICDLCSPKLTNCPTCDKAFTTARNFLAESLIRNYLVVNCNYCEENFKFGEIEAHSTSCAFRPIECLFGTCTDGPNPKKVNLKTFAQHLITEHEFKEIDVNLPSNEELDLGTFGNEDEIGDDGDVEFFSNLYKFENKHFTVEYSSERGFLIFWVILIGDENLIKDYEAIISLYKNENTPDEKKVKFHSSIYSVRKSSYDITEEIYMALRLSAIETMFGLDEEDKVLKLRVEIRKKS